jgi:hypothetical protein
MKIVLPAKSVVVLFNGVVCCQGVGKFFLHFLTKSSRDKETEQHWNDSLTTLQNNTKHDVVGVLFSCCYTVVFPVIPDTQQLSINMTTTVLCCSSVSLLSPLVSNVFKISDGFFIEGCNGICFCDACLMSSDSEKENEGSQRTGEPEREFWLPRGWCSFELRRAAVSEPPWHIAYCQLPAPTLRRCLDSRALLSGGKIA